jgi:hypothetical protein
MDNLMRELERIAKEHFDGHFTVMRFTTNWRVWFGTPSVRGDIQAAPVGKTFAEAAGNALEKWRDDPEYFEGTYCCLCGARLPTGNFDDYACKECCEESTRLLEEVDIGPPAGSA